MHNEMSVLPKNVSPCIMTESVQKLLAAAVNPPKKKERKKKSPGCPISKIKKKKATKSHIHAKGGVSILSLLPNNRCMYKKNFSNRIKLHRKSFSNCRPMASKMFSKFMSSPLD